MEAFMDEKDNIIGIQSREIVQLKALLKSCALVMIDNAPQNSQALDLVQRINQISTGLYRTLVRVISINSDSVVVVIPGWSPSETVTVDKSAIPKPVLDHMQPGYRYHAKVPLSADIVEQIFFVDWEIPKKQLVEE